MKFFRLPVVLLFVSLIAGQAVRGQYFSVGNDPSGIKWRQIEGDRLNLIYPDYYEATAQEMYRNSLKIIPNASSSLFLNPGHFRVVIHPETIQSNGWTTWVPRKIDLAPLPSLYNMSERYSDHLLIHEYRHIVQLDKMDQGLTKVLGWFFGDQAAASVQALHVPDWVSEGDAVLTETFLSHSGRGRNPLFTQGLRALMLGDEGLKFDKARFGSYKDFVPDHYVLGYHMVSMARILDKDNFWSDYFDIAARRPWRVANFNRFLHKRTGLWQSDLYNETKKFLSENWIENSILLGTEQIDMISEESSDYYNYLKPYAETDSSWICLRNSYSDLPAIVRVFRDRKDELILYTGSINDASFSYSNGSIVWAQQIADPRWEMRSFSDIFLYDIQEGRKQRLTKKRRLLYPVLNSEGTEIACIEERIDGSSHLVILNSDGLEVASVAAPSGYVFRQPVWSDSGRHIYALQAGRDGKKLVAWNIDESGTEVLHDYGYKEVNQMDRLGDHLVFSAPIGTVQGLYAFNLNDKSISKIAASENGLDYPAVSRGQLCLSVFSTTGYRPAEINEDQEFWIAAPEVEDLNEPLIPEVVRAENENPVVYDLSAAEIVPSSKYEKSSHLFNFHSWAPVFLDTDNYLIRPGAMIMTQNDLNTLVSTFGIKQNKATRGLDYFADVNFTGFYPEIGLGVLAGKRQVDTLRLDNDVLTDAHYSDVETSINVKVPLFYSHGAYYQYLQPYFSLTHHNTYNGHSLDAIQGGARSFDIAYATATLGLAGQVLRRKSYRDLYPRWGFTAGVQADAGIANPEVRAFKRFSAYGRFYAPGILKNHSLITYVGYSRQDKFSMPVLPFVSLPRGHYEAANYDYSSYKVDYSFPVAYPDWAIPSVLYITRLKANAFVDGAYTTYRDEPWSMTTGVDITSDFYFLRIGVEFEAGARIIYDPMATEKAWKVEFLYSFDIE